MRLRIEFEWIEFELKNIFLKDHKVENLVVMKMEGRIYDPIPIYEGMHGVDLEKKEE